MSAAEFLRDLIRIQALPGQEETLRERVLQEWRQLGFEDVHADAGGNALARVRGREPGAAWLLLTHLDHVHEGDPALWAHPPYEAVLAEGVIHGRGAVDIKGPLAAQTYALAALLAKGERPRSDVWIVAAAEEEVGGPGAAYLVAHPPGEIGAVIVAEPSGSQLMLGHRGVARVRVRLQGRAHHASLAIKNENPIFALAELLRRIEALTFPDFPVTGASTLTVTQLFTDSGSENLTPNTVTAILDWRFNEDDAYNRRVLAKLLEGLPAQGELSALWTPEYTPGFVTEPNDPLTLKVRPYAARFHAEPGVWRFATDGRYTANAGWPTVGWGPGNEGLAHTTKESVKVADIDAYSEALAELLLNESPS